jgi:hypothetical protein
MPIPTNEQLQKRITDLYEIVAELGGRIQVLEGKKKKPVKGESDGSKVWELYKELYFQRYKTDPVRNAKVNANCSALVTRLGLDGALDVVRFFLKQNDQRFLSCYHGLHLCLYYCEALHTAMKKGKLITQNESKKIENTASNIDTSRSYLEKKHGGNK